MSYTPTIWENGKKPAINATNLNKIENELAKLDNIVSMPDITTTTETTIPNSYEGRLKIDSIEGGESQQNTTSGKNILKNKATSTTTKGVTFTVNADGTVVVNGTASEDVGLTINSNFALEIGKSYVLSGCPSGGSASTYRIRLTDANYVYNNYDVGNGVQFEEKTGSAMAILIIYAGCTVNNLVFKPMVRLASVTDATYEPYTNGASPNPSYPQEIKKTVVSEIKTRKNNMFDVSKFKTNQYINGDGSVSANGAWGASDYMLAKVPSITISHKDSMWFQLAIAEYDSKKKFIRITSKQGFLPAVTQELSENTSYIRISYSIDVGNGAFEREEVMINEGTTALPYEPYTESVITLSQPIELYGRGDFQDVIEGGKTKRKFGVKVFNGSEGWGLDSASGRMYTFAYQGKWKGSPSNDVVADALCSHYIVKTPNDTYSKKEGFAVSADGGITIYDARFSDVESFKAWLAQNPITIICRLATPTTEALPIADQIALNSLSTYDGITYLEFDSEIEPTFKGEYGTSKLGGYTLEGMLAGRNGELYGKDYNSRLSALETSVVNNI